MEAIILAGGLGTRLRSAVADVPKSMADINGKPFLAYQLELMYRQGVRHFILATGYKAASIHNFFGTKFKTADITYARESQPLGTGGAIKFAMQFARSENVIVANGDSLFVVSLAKLLAFHQRKKASVSLSLKPMQQFERFGCVIIDEQDKIMAFEEKKYVEEGLINAGVYCIQKQAFEAILFPEAFSIERDYFEKYCDRGAFYGLAYDGYFIDIGIPADYNALQSDIHDVMRHFDELNK